MILIIFASRDILKYFLLIDLLYDVIIMHLSLKILSFKSIIFLISVFILCKVHLLNLQPK